MPKVTVDQIRERLRGIEERRQHYEWKSEQPGRLRLHEVWRHMYLAYPYLIGAPDDPVYIYICRFVWCSARVSNAAQSWLSVKFLRGITSVFFFFQSEWRTLEKCGHIFGLIVRTTASLRT